MKYRTITAVLQKSLKQFPAVILTGPRQSGKTTLLRHLLGRTHAYINLEDPDTRLRAKEDPRRFLEENKPPVIFDEIQYAAELLPYIKTLIDERRRPGQWVLTGSQSFILMRNVSESLAGRAAILTLLPFSFTERFGWGSQSVDTPNMLNLLCQEKINAPQVKANIAEVILKGGYPGLTTRRGIDLDVWSGSYISTYLERDIRNLAQVGDLHDFERFLRICATRTGQILNISEIARDVGCSVPTAKRWLSMLEAGCQVFLLYPYYRNIGKRFIKSPKLYFVDTALSTYLLGLREAATLLKSPHFPHLFETFIVVDFWKRFVSFGQLPSLYYFKTPDGLEVDLVLEVKQKLHLFEIKSSSTITPTHASSLRRSLRDLKTLVGSAQIISNTKDDFAIDRFVRNYSWRQILSL